MSGNERKKTAHQSGKDAEGEIVLDDTGRKNGRGAYICRSSECLAKARKTKAIERSLGIEVSQEVYEELEKEMTGLDG